MFRQLKVLLAAAALIASVFATPGAQESDADPVMSADRWCC